MSENHRRSDWQVLGAAALIALGALLLLDRLDLPWLGLVREAVAFAIDVAWPLIIIALGVLLLVSARRGGLTHGAGQGGKRWMRSRTERMVGGVLGGLAEYLGVDPLWVRIVFVVLAFLSGHLFLAGMAYVVGLMLIPEAPRDGVRPPVWPNMPGAPSTHAHSAATAPEPPSWVAPPPGATETVQSPEPPAPPAPPVG